MVRIRMQRFGRTHRPFYRINAIDIRTRRNGKVIENLGWYNPVAPAGQEQLHLKEDRIREWLARGAQPSDTVMDMLGHRDLLSDRMKAQWLVDREKSRLRVTCKQSQARAEAAVAALEAMVKGAKVSPAAHVEAAKAAAAECKRFAASGRVEQAEAAAVRAEGALAAANKAESDAKAEAKPAE